MSGRTWFRRHLLGKEKKKNGSTRADSQRNFQPCFRRVFFVVSKELDLLDQPIPTMKKGLVSLVQPREHPPLLLLFHGMVSFIHPVTPAFPFAPPPLSPVFGQVSSKKKGNWERTTPLLLPETFNYAHVACRYIPISLSA